MSVKIFRCKFCNKTEQMFKKKELGIAVNLINSFDDPERARVYCCNLNHSGGKGG